MDFTAKEIILLVLGSGGFIGGLISAFVFITGRLDERRKRLREGNTDNAELLKIKQSSTDSVHAQLWKIIDEKNEELEAKDKLAEDLEKKAVLQRPIINQIYRNIRAMRTEIESLGVMALDDAATKIFMKRFNAVKELLDATEEMLP